jgi:octaprenyl-diphosphate synthase
MNSDILRQLMQPDMQQLDHVIRTDLNSNVVLIREISNYIISAGGKRIRPLLTILCGKLTNYDPAIHGNMLYKMAAMIEYIHTATLLHDDIVDESNLRRGRKTANATFGNAASVLVGDFIYTRAFQMMVEANSLRLLKIMADSTNQISEGEVLQLLNIGRHDISEIEYFEVIKHKTATLFEAAARVGAIMTGANIATENALASYAIAVGNAFQIMDDVLDYMGNSEQMGKNIGDDLLEGKVTLPLVYLIKNGSDHDKNLIIDAIRKPKDCDIDLVINTVKQSQAIDYCQKISAKFVDTACESLAIFPDSDYKQAMLFLAYSAINREQ